MDKSDEINHPAHYNQGRIEVIEAVESWDLNFCLGNVVKYVARSKYKGEPLKDLQKALWYLNKEIATQKGETSAIVGMITQKERDGLSTL